MLHFRSQIILDQIDTHSCHPPAMSDTKNGLVTTEPTSSALDDGQGKGLESADGKSTNITLAQRGDQVTQDADYESTEATLIRDRTLLSAQEEKALLRRIDWRIMTICSLLFLMKNIDADNISNARIMNKGTDRNIMTQLNMTSDEYNLLNVLYYVRSDFT